MKKVLLIAVLLVMVPMIANAESVRGYWRDSDGDGLKETYVQPHLRTSPNSTTLDNYSYPGNYNPNTGSTTPQHQHDSFHSTTPMPKPLELPKMRY